MLKGNLLGTASSDITSTSHHVGNKQFLQFYLQNPASIKRIRLATLTGDGWFDDPEMIAILRILAEYKIELQILGNPESAIMKKLLFSMQATQKSSPSICLNTLLAKWHDRELTYSNIVLRVSDYPLLRQSLMIEFKDNTSQILLCDYTYGASIENTSLHRWLCDSHPDHTYYKTESEYLWNISSSYESWLDTLPLPEEIIKPGNYILMYPSHTMNEDTTSIGNPKWIYSVLSITSDNLVSLKANVSTPFESTKDYEYSYQGRLKLTRNNIFISLYDKEQQEAISISLSRPLYDKNRFLGIMTALSPAGQPVAFKCACIGHSLLSNLNQSLLQDLLMHPNREWNETLMILENHDINLFYSDKILTKHLILKIDNPKSTLQKAIAGLYNLIYFHNYFTFYTSTNYREGMNSVVGVPYWGHR